MTAGFAIRSTRRPVAPPTQTATQSMTAAIAAMASGAVSPQNAPHSDGVTASGLAARLQQHGRRLGRAGWTS